MHCPKIMFWRLIDLACILAALLQLGFIIEGFIQPTLLNTSVKEVDLREMDFPIDIKICAQPGFNMTALNEMGYGHISGYFFGRSQFNSSIIGWAGHTENFEVRGSVEEVFNAVRNHRIEDIIERSNVQLSSGKYQDVSMQQFQPAARVNYPQNCFRLNVTFMNDMQQEGIRTLWIDFNTTKTEKVQVDFHGGSLIANREIYDDAFDMAGDAIIAEPGNRVAGIGQAALSVRAGFFRKEGHPTYTILSRKALNKSQPASESFQ